MQREQLARALRCFNTLTDERPPDCPRLADLAPSAPSGRQGERSPLDAFTPAERAALFAGIDRPCTPGLHAANFVLSYCARNAGPARPSRSAEEICADGGIGPCHPPPEQ